MTAGNMYNFVKVGRGFYRATPYWRGICRSRVSVRLSQVGVLLKRLNVGSRKQRHTIAQRL